MKWWVAYLIIIGLLIVGVAVYLASPYFTGKSISWISGDDSFADPANPEPSLSPLPSDSLLTGVPSVTENCAEAKSERVLVCEDFSEKYPTGCKWYHFAFDFVFDCRELRKGCSNAQDKVNNECK